MEVGSYLGKWPLIWGKGKCSETGNEGMYSEYNKANDLSRLFCHGRMIR
jgi:hypothetical protein